MSLLEKIDPPEDAPIEPGKRLIKLDHSTPADMRGPGGTEGMYAIECAMDELAYAAKIDPLELRLINYSEQDQRRQDAYRQVPLSRTRPGPDVGNVD